MAWIVLIFIAINGLLLSLYFDTERNIGGEALLLFNVPVLLAGVLFYLIARFTSNR
jgi:hypothetical protein